MVMMLTHLADVARSAGLTVVEVPGWKSAGRPGGMLGVRTITCHHTGGLKDLNTIVMGRDIGLPTELKGPLAQLFLARDGVVHVVAAGKCNHAGVSLKVDYENPYAVGIEAEAVGVPGTKGDWPPVQTDAYHRLCRALVEEFGLGISDVRGHKETCKPKGRKSDPDLDMHAFRAAVAAVDLHPKKPAVEEDMQWDDKIKLTAEDAKWWGPPYTVGQEVTIGTMLRYSTMARRTEKELADFRAESADRAAKLEAQIDQLTAAVQALINPK